MNKIKQLLDEKAAQFNTPDFILSDPIQFPRRFSRLQDIEIAALLCSTIAWGNRKMICRDCERLLTIMKNEPYNFVIDKAYEELPEGNIHRTFFTQNLKHYLRGLHKIYSTHDSLNSFANAHHINKAELPAWHLASLINTEIAAANNGETDSRCLPSNLGSADFSGGRRGGQEYSVIFAK